MAVRHNVVRWSVKRQGRNCVKQVWEEDTVKRLREKSVRSALVNVLIVDLGVFL
jgi:hypothetical protein